MKKSLREAAIVACALVMQAGCGEGSGRWGGTISDSAGIQVVMNPEAGLWAGEMQPTVEEELRIGRAEGDPNYQFGMIAGVDVADDGSIVVLDQQARVVRVYDAAGQFLRTMGGPGGGPGELSPGAVGLIVLADTILVPDMGLQRMTRYTLNGDVLESFPIPMAEGIAVRWVERGDGRLVQQARIMSFPGQPTIEPKDLLLLRESNGVVTDTLMTLPAGRTFTATENSMSMRFFEAEPVWAMHDDGSVWFAMNSEYSIQQYNAEGELQRIVRRPYEKKPVTEADKTEFLDMLRELMTRQGAPPAAVDQMLGITSFAETYPAFANLLAGPEGTLWVQRIRTATEVQQEGGTFDIQDTGSSTWDVFATNGRYLGPVTLPERFTPIRVIGDRMYGIWRDELDVQHVMEVRVTLPDSE